MAAQMNYNFSTPKGVVGGKYDLAFDEVVTRSNENENGVMKFGLAVAQGTNVGHGVIVPVTGTTADKIEGITLCTPTEQDTDGNVVIKKNATLGIMKHGNVWGRLANGVTPVYGNTAYVVVSGDDAGAFTTETSGTIDIGAKFGNASDDGIAVITL